MTLTITIAPVRKSVVVDVDPARAFEVFTAGFDRWWPKKVPADPARQAALPAVVESVIEPLRPSATRPGERSSSAFDPVRFRSAKSRGACRSAARRCRSISRC